MLKQQTINKTDILPSISSQCPVRTQIHTIIKDRKKDKISAAVKRPHTPNDILQFFNVNCHIKREELSSHDALNTICHISYV
jgi:hypothetical protein